jgi:biotin operon repressor
MKDFQQTADGNGGTAMSKDPFLEREAEKYESPIPSREFILEHLAKRETPASREEIGNELNLSGEESLEALRRRLRAMERDGQLVFTRRQCYALPERLDLLQRHGDRSSRWLTASCAYRRREAKTTCTCLLNR